jgi:hypothetical protein
MGIDASGGQGKIKEKDMKQRVELKSSMAKFGDRPP